MRSAFTKREWGASVVLVVLLLIKFFWPLFVYHVPLGYDLWFYRYLFLRHAQGFPPFWIAPMDEWAKGHPLGLFFFSTILLKLGVPVSWLLGWIWNVFPVILAVALAIVIGKRETENRGKQAGIVIGMLVLVAALLSLAYFDGFAAMYWKTYASLLWCIITYRLLEKKSWWAIVTGILCVATHHQTGLLFGLAFASWVLWHFCVALRTNPRAAIRGVLPYVIAGLVVCGMGLLTYLPVWNTAVLANLPALLGGETDAGGNFPPMLFYLQTEGILLALGLIGLALSIKRERFTLWQLSVLWCLVFVVGHLLFFRRFFLQLDFFLLPFAALAMCTFWQRFSRPVYRGLLVVALLIQLGIGILVLQTRTPVVNASDIQAISAMEPTLPSDAFVLGLDNQTAATLRGYLPFTHVGGPGLFESTWTYDQWKQFLLGTHQDRVQLLSTVPGTVFLYASPFFLQYYGTYATTFLSDPCFMQTSVPSFYRVTCTP